MQLKLNRTKYASLRLDDTFSRLANITILFIVTLFVVSPVVLPVDGQALTARPERGSGGNGGRQNTDIDSISLQSGSVNVQMPLASLPPMAGGKLGYTLSASYDSKLWNAHRKEVQGLTNDGLGCQTRYSTQEVWAADNGGWRIGGQYEIFFRDAHDDYDYLWPSNVECYGYDFYYMQTRFFKPMLRAPDGSEHELRIEGYFAQYPGYLREHLQSYYVQSSGLPNEPVFSGPVRFYTTDGTYLTVIYRGPSDSIPWTIYTKDGTRIEKSAAGQRTIDTNGNSILKGLRMVGGIPEEFVKDEATGREIKWSAATYESQTATKVEYQTVGGAWQTVFVVWKQTTVRGKVHSKVSWNPNVGGGATCAIDVALLDASFTVIKEIVYPGTEQTPVKYSFGYNSDLTVQTTLTNPQWSCTGSFPSYTRTASTGWGELNDVTTPTGAHIKYNYANDGAHEFIADIFLGAERMADEAVKNTVTSKVVEHDGTTDTWNYSVSFPSNGSPSGGLVTNPDGSTHVEIYNPTELTYPWLGGYDGKGGLLVRSWDSGRILTEKHWTLKGGTLLAYGSNSQMTTYNSVVDTEYVSLLDESGNRVKMTAKTFDYDYNGELTKTTEYDWINLGNVTYTTNTNGAVAGIPTGVPSGTAILRVTDSSYYNTAANAADATAYHKRTVAPSTVILGKPMEVKVGDGTTVKSTTQFSFDGQTYGTAPTKGNLTKVSAYNDTTFSWINALTTYASNGNVTSTTDANGVETTITYGLVGGYSGLYPTQVETASNYASLKRTSTAAYDFYTGLATTATDVDNNVSVATEYDALGRPVKVRGAAGTLLESQVRTEYNDVARRVIVRSDLETIGDGKKVAVQHYDQLGRVRLSRSIENILTEDPYNETHGIKVETRYQTGNPNSYQLSSNPFRAATATAATSEPSMGWTRSKSINTGRHSEIETFSGSALPAPWGNNTNSTGIVQTDVDANAATVTDQALKQRRSITNALGQLVRVDEPTANGLGSISSPNQPTSYAYDTLNNLTTVNQGVQTRSFAYNSLSRLLSATNPESGTINYGYDSNGNLTSKTDARGVVTSYVYDALSRVTNRNYTAPNPLPPNYQTTPNVSYFYDNLPNAKGKLIKVSSSVSTTEYTGFDLLGRVTSHKQRTDNTDYTTGYVYNLSGALIEETYPSGRVVKNTLDVDGDLQQVQSAKANQGLKNYANGFVYTASGAVSSMRLGNGKFESTQFNSRLQPIQIGLGASAASTNLLKLNYTYNTPGNADNNGNVLSQQITVPTVGANQGFTATQTYTYDSLNRLKDAKEMVGATQTWKQTFTFDRYGNRNFDMANNNTTTLAANCPAAVCNPTVNATNNRLNGYQFDTSGNTTTDAENRTFIYDAENKQVQVNNSNGIVGQYFYDGDGLRIKKVVPATGETTVFVYDASNKVVAEYSTIVEPTSTAKTSYLTNDHLGSPRINTDAIGQIIARHDYLPFGEEIQSGTGGRNSAQGYGGQDSIRRKFTTYDRDTETNLDYAQARMFGSGLGRFTSPDPTLLSVSGQNPQTWNRYAYVMNNPLNFTDPLGLWAINFEEIWKQKDGKDELDKNGKRILAGIFITFTKSKEGDDGASLAKQLGLSGKDATEFAKLVGDADTVPVGDFLNSKSFRTDENKNLLSEISNVFKHVANRLTAEYNSDRKNKGPADAEEANCAGSCDDLAGGSNGLRIQPVDFDKILKSEYKSIDEQNLRIRDVIRYATDSGKTPKHFTTFLFKQDNGTPYVFSKSGDRGIYETGTASSFQSTGYGNISGFYHRK